MQWQRTLRYAVAIVFVAVLVAVLVTVRGRKPAAGPASVARVDPKAAVELPQGADIVWTEKDRETFTLAFTRGLSYPDGRYAFTNVRVRIPDRRGRTAEITARDGDIFAPPGEPRRGTFRHDVVIGAGDGLVLTTEEASYSETDHLVQIPGAFSFTRGRTSGSGRNATYDQNNDVLVVRADPRVQVEPGTTGEDRLDIRAGRAQLNRQEHTIRFEERATVVRGTQTTTANVLIAHLTADEQRLSGVELRGGAHVIDSAAGAGALRSMQARDIDLAYGPDGRTLTGAMLRGKSALEIAGTGAAVRRLAAETIDADLAEDGRTLRGLRAATDVQLDLPPEGDTPGRRIQASALQGSGAAEGLRDATFTGGVEYREARGTLPPAGTRPGPTERVARADRLDAKLKPGFGAPESAVFRGHAVIREGETTGEAGVVDYSPDRNAITLQTPTGVAGPAPRVSDERVNVTAPSIDFTLTPRRLNAAGGVRSILRPKSASRDRAGASSDDASRLPVMLKRDEPVNITSDRLEYDGDAAHATYRGSARLWQGETTIQGSVLVLDDRAGDLTADGPVRTRMIVEQVDQKTKKREPVESIGSADAFAYDDEARRATYTGRARLTGPQGDVRAKKIELFLHDDGRTLDRAEAYDDVVAHMQGGQEAFGARLTFFGVDERYVMSGTPVRILETVDGGCRETLGAALTFIRSTDTISVVGTAGNRSRTMPGSCTERAEPPHDRTRDHAGNRDDARR